MEEQEHNKRTPEELYQTCLTKNLERMLQRIEYDVVNHGKRKGTFITEDVSLSKVEFKQLEGMELPYLCLSRLTLSYGFNTELKITRNIEKNLFGKKGTVHFTIQKNADVDKVFNDFKKEFKKEGIAVKLGYCLFDNDYETTLDEEGLLGNDGTYKFSISVEDVNNYHASKSAKWCIFYEL